MRARACVCVMAKDLDPLQCHSCLVVSCYDRMFVCHSIIFALSLSLSPSLFIFHPPTSSSLSHSLPHLSPRMPSFPPPLIPSFPPSSTGPHSRRVKLAQPLPVRTWEDPRNVRSLSSPTSGQVSMATKDDSFIQMPGLLAPYPHSSIKRRQTMPSRSRDCSPIIQPRPEEPRFL